MATKLVFRILHCYRSDDGSHDGVHGDDFAVVGRLPENGNAVTPESLRDLKIHDTCWGVEHLALLL